MKIFRGIVIFLLITYASSEDSSCHYDFESDTEMEDFDLTCDGLKGEWKIEDVPDNIPLPTGHGERGLTINQQSNGCMQSSKRLMLNTTTKVGCKFYWKKEQSGSVNFKIKFITALTDKAVNSEWDIAAKYDNQIGEKWFEDSYDFIFPEIQDYKLQIMLYLNSAKVLIDSITIFDTVGNSDQCYVHPRTTTTEFATTTTELETTTTTSEATTTTTTSEATTTTTDVTTTTTEDTTTATANEEPTTTTDLKTTTTEETTTTTEALTEPPTSDSSTTTELPDLPETSPTTTSATQTDATPEITITTTFIDRTTTASSLDDYSDASSSTPSRGTSPPDIGNRFPDPNLSFIPILVIISLIMIGCFCSIGIWLRRRRRRKNSKTDLHEFHKAEPQLFYGEKQKTDHEFYYEIAEEWKATSKRHHGPKPQRKSVGF